MTLKTFKGIALAAILAAAMMMEHLEESGMAASIQSAVRAALASGGARTPDLGGAATTLAATGSVIEGLG